MPLVFFVLLCLFGASALDADVVTIDFPVKSAPSKVSSLLSEAPRQVSTPDGMGYAEVSLPGVQDDRNLLISVVFIDNEERGLAVYWINGVTGQQTGISSDLSEGVSGINQRTLLMPWEATCLPGKLIIQGDQSKLLRLKLDWATSRKIYASTEQKPVAVMGDDRLLQSTEITGEKPLAPPDLWLGGTFEASLQETPESLSENVEFLATLNQQPEQCVLSAKLLGLPLSKSVEVWVNGVRVGQLQPIVPPLSDVGYLQDESGKTIYAGWRKGAIYIPTELFMTGDNSILFVSPGGDTFIRDATLQLKRLPESLVESGEELISHESITVP